MTNSNNSDNPEPESEIEEVTLYLSDDKRVVIGHVKNTSWGIYRLGGDYYYLTGSAYVKEMPEGIRIIVGKSDTEQKDQSNSAFLRWLDGVIEQSSEDDKPEMPHTLLGKEIVYTDPAEKWSEEYIGDEPPIVLGDLSAYMDIPVPPHDPMQPTDYEKANWDNMTRKEWERPADDEVQ